MASMSENQINLKTLQRVDSSIIEIIDSACQVAIYKYERKLGKWEGTDVEGTLFLYRRSCYPCYGFIIVNRMSTTNFIESITDDMQFQLKSPYLLYKNHCGDIIGSWFYEHKDLRRISKRIQTIILKHHSPPKRQRCASESETQDILTLLCEAQKEYMEKICLQPNENSCENDNNLNTDREKTFIEKSVCPLKNKNGDSQNDHSPVSPRRRYMSTGSFDSNCAKRGPLLFSSSQSIPEIKKENIYDSRVRMDGTVPSSNKSLNVSTCDKSPPQTCLQEDTCPFEVKEETSHSPLLEPLNWKDAMFGNASIHSANIKEAIRSHIEENPKFMPKIHEAYVSSLKTYFTQ